jgi:ATPase subunit of ABC transporter with duplicated ATPase domains
MIVAKNLRFNELGDTLFEKVNLVIRDGERVGVMGSSAHIVTTFLQVLSGDTEMDEGTVTAAGEKVTYVSAEKFSENVESFESLLGARPTFIILDAQVIPAEISPAIMKCVRSFCGGMLIASSDASIMSAAKITRMIEVHAPTKSVMSFTANYADYLVEREKNEARNSEAYRKQQKEKKRLEDWLEQKRKEASIDRSPQKGSTIRTKAKYLQREILNKEIPRPAQFEEPDSD